MKLKTGNMFDYATGYSILLVTTNAIVKKDGSLVMGRGAALEAAKRWPWLPHQLGQAIAGNDVYGVIIPSYLSSAAHIMIGAFQVKYHWREEASLSLIAQSTIKLKALAEMMPHESIALNFPGIGNGRLPREDVLAIIQYLPDNVDVWEYDASL